jgi:hypothetical protein
MIEYKNQLGIKKEGTAKCCWKEERSMALFISIEALGA